MSCGEGENILRYTYLILRIADLVASRHQLHYWLCLCIGVKKISTIFDNMVPLAVQQSYLSS